jgi:sortase A
MTAFLEERSDRSSGETVSRRLSPTKGGATFWRRTEKALLFFGILMLTAYASARLDTEFSSRLILDRFDSLPARGSDEGLNLDENVDFTAWNPKRIQAYQQSLLAKKDQPIAVLRIPKIHLKVPVFNGTDDLSLNRGVGRIVGTAEIGQNGNTGIAGHRDGFFRGLKDIEPGDTLELVTRGKTMHFVVERTQIVQPEDIGVLADTGVSALTLVTCFPFYFVGNAPQRFIVHASPAGFDGLNGPPNTLARQIKRKENPK